MGWLIAFALIACIAIIPIGVQASYDNLGTVLKLIAGPVRIVLYPGKKKAKKQKQKDSFTGTAKQTGKSGGGSVFDFLPLLRLVLDLLSTFRKKLRVSNLRMKLILGGGDPCDLAINYGRAWATLGNMLPLLESVFLIKKRDLEVECNFNADKTTIVANVDLTITVGSLLSISVRYGIRAIKEYIKIMKKRKGGAVI